jgi:hypothetical protein
MEPRIVVEAESIRPTNSQSLFGKIYLAEEPNAYFPELGWTDFVGSILDQSLKVVEEIAPNERARVPFLDGPFALEFTRLDDERLQIACKRKSKGEESEVLSTQARHETFRNNLLATAESVLQVCDEHGWQDLPVVMALRFRVAGVKQNRLG